MAGAGIQKVDLQVFTDMMRISTLRGVDGTGVFHGNFGQYLPNTFIFKKEPIEVNNFFRKHKDDKFLLKSMMDNVFIGHTRWATLGGMDEASCHPFKIKNIVGTHNGTMTDLKYFQKDKTDSELLYEDIQRRDLKTVLSEVEYESAYALAMFDTKKYELSFVRNPDRELHVAFHTTRRVMYWASEAEFIKCATDRHGVTIADPCYFEPHVIHRINLKDIDKYNKESDGFEIERYTPREKGSTKYSMNYSAIAWGDTSGIPFDTSSVGPAMNTNVVRLQPKLTKAERKEQRRRDRETRAITAGSGLNPAVIVKHVKTQCPKIPTYTCISCGRPLRLIDQYYADKAVINSTNETIFECSGCKKLGKQLVDGLSVTIN